MNIQNIWSDYRASLQSFLHSRVSNPAEVDDLLQEVLIKTHRNIHTLQSESSIKPWLFQIANRAIIDFYRQRAKSQNLTADELWYGDEDAIEQPLAQCIVPFINALPKQSAELLTAIDLNGQSQKAYAEARGVSYSTLKSRVKKSRGQLRALFQDCCHLSLDRQGNVVDYEPKGGGCKEC